MLNASLALQLRVPCPVDLPHAAGSEEAGRVRYPHTEKAPLMHDASRVPVAFDHAEL